MSVKWLGDFAEMMWENGHMNFRCPECSAVFWLEAADNQEYNVELKRYANVFVDDCETCVIMYERWNKAGAFDIEEN